MANRDRLAMFPSRANSVLIRNRIQSANKGLNMLRRKRDALEIKLRDLIVKRNEVASNCHELFKAALFSIAKANFLNTDFKPAPIIGSDRADAYMRISYTKTIGVALPTFEPILRKPESLPLTGLSKGGKQVEVVRERFQELLKVIVLMATFDFSIKILKDAIRSNNMRLNGLEYVIVPRLANTFAYIRDELDEMEREEFYRLKRSQQKQNKQNVQEVTLKEEQDDFYFDSCDRLFCTKTYIDASTSIDNKFIEESIISIFQKIKASNEAQTVITGHFPGSNEIISPTDSILSGDPSIFIRRHYMRLNKRENAPGPSTHQPMQSQIERKKTVPQIPLERNGIEGPAPSNPNKNPKEQVEYLSAESTVSIDKDQGSHTKREK